MSQPTSAELYPVTLPISATPGDLLIIFEGRCIGVCRPTTTPARTTAKLSPSDLLHYFTKRPITVAELNEKLGFGRADRVQRELVSRHVRLLAKEGKLQQSNGTAYSHRTFWLPKEPPT